jgi:hypothetical protein
MPESALAVAPGNGSVVIVSCDERPVSANPVIREVLKYCSVSRAEKNEKKNLRAAEESSEHPQIRSREADSL